MMKHFKNEPLVCSVKFIFVINNNACCQLNTVTDSALLGVLNSLNMH